MAAQAVASPASAVMPMWERVRLCKALATQMPQGRRFYVDTRGNVQFPERLQLSKQHQQPSHTLP